MTTNYDIVILGSGFGGSLIALVLSQRGYRVAVVDRAKHPRFAIGESSTPIADQALRRIAESYDLPWLTTITRYGTAKTLSPNVRFGLKRGFSYFNHISGQPFGAGANHENELLVAASTSDDVADTHWHRSSVDHWFTRQLANYGIDLLEHTEVEEIERTTQKHWGVRVRQCERGQTSNQQLLRSRFIVDASGRSGALMKHLSIERSTYSFKTNTSATYGHFTGMRPWSDIHDDVNSTPDHPFRSDRAAVHHLLDDGWMWQLPFDHDITSCGLVSDLPRTNHTQDEQRWRRALDPYPSLAEQFSASKCVAPHSGLVTTGRLQFLRQRAAGDGWLALPATTGFVDPLHSTGIAQTVLAIEVIGAMFAHDIDSREMRAALEDYDLRLQTEFRWIDSLVSVCYHTRRCFPLFVAATMLYFVAVTSCEQAGVQRGRRGWFLDADNRALRNAIKEVISRFMSVDASALNDDQVAELITFADESTRPFNRVGLFHAETHNIYRHTTAE